MNNLIQVNGKKQLVISSREVAEMLGKSHSDLLKEVDGRASGDGVGIIPTLQKLNELKGNLPLNDYFIENEYKAKNGRKVKEYLITKKGCELIGNKQQGEKGIMFSIMYVERFNQMEEALQEKQVDSYMIEDPIERAKAWIKEQEEKQALAKTVEIQAPKVEYHDKVLNTQGAMTTTQVAKALGLKSAIQLNNMLHELGIQYKQSGQWFLYSKHADKGYTKTSTHLYEDKNGYSRSKKATKWTEKGMKFIYEALKEHGLIGGNK